MTTSCYLNSAPEAPSTINVTQNTIAMDSGEAKFYNEQFLGAAVKANVVAGSSYYMTLAHTPVNTGAVVLFVQGVAQLPYPVAAQNFRVVGKQVIVTMSSIDDTDIFLVHYFGYAPTGDEVDGGVSCGTILPCADADAVPSGYLLMDGSTVYTKASYPALWNYVLANDLGISTSATEFTLKDINFTLNIGGGDVSVDAMIKT